jgi:hypothetical protein
MWLVCWTASIRLIPTHGTHLYRARLTILHRDEAREDVALTDHRACWIYTDTLQSRVLCRNELH